jgi:hypothetical protein
VQLNKKFGVPADRMSRVKQAPVRSGAPARAPDPEIYESEDQGLPAWMTTPKFVFWAFLITVFSANWIYVSVLNTTGAGPNTDCVTITSPAGSDGGQWLTEHNQFLEHRARERRGAASRTQQCFEENCAGEEWRSYVQVVSEYVNGRARLIDYAHRVFGPNGLSNAFDYYTTSEDYSILNGAQDMLNSGKLKYSDFGADDATHLRLLLDNKNSTVPVCFKPE